MAPQERKICECCGQTIATTARASRERHYTTVMDLYDVTEEELVSKSRNVYLSSARHHLWFLLVIEDHWSLARAARLLDRKHHAVLYGVRKHGMINLKTQGTDPIEKIRYEYWKSFGLSEDEIQEKISL